MKKFKAGFLPPCVASHGFFCQEQRAHRMADFDMSEWGEAPGFCHFTVTGADSGGATQTQGGWVVVGNPAASLTITAENNQTGAHGTTLPVSLTVSLAPGSSGGANPASGASILFSTNAGTLSNGTSTGSKVIATTNGSAVASVTLTLPSTAQSVTVTAEGPYGLGHPIVTFTETSQ